MKLLIKNGTIINEWLSFRGSLFVCDGIIEDITSDAAATLKYESEADQVVDAEGLYVMPGVIDDQVHFREPGAEYKGGIGCESAAAVLGGVTSFMDMPNNNPPTCSIDLLNKKFDIAANASYANYSFYLGADNDNISEIVHLDKNRVCGVKVFMGSSTGNMLVSDPDVLDAIFSNSPVLIATHCEEESIIKRNLNDAIARFGEDIPISEHPNIRSREACIASTRKAINLALRNKSRLHILHISTEEEINLIRVAQKVNPDISAEICVHYLWFCDKDYESFGAKIKCNPAIKSEHDRYALRHAVRAGIIPVVATDHAPHLLSEKQQDYLHSPSGLPLVQYSLLMMLELCKQGVFKIENVVESMSHAPARCFNVKGRGFIRKGYYADLTLFDYEKGCTVAPVCKCGWSPFTSFSSSVVHTFVNGVQVVKDGKLTGLRNSKELYFER